MVKIAKTKTLVDRIEINPNKMVGKPVIFGTRITVEHVLNMLAVGRTPEEIIDDFPPLTKEDILAAVLYAAKMIEDTRLYPREYIRQIHLQAAQSYEVTPGR